MALTIQPMNLGDIFDRLFKLFGKTLRRNLILTLIVIVPASLILAYGMDAFFGKISDFASLRSESDFDSIEDWGPMLSGLASMGVAGILFMLGYLAAMLGVTIIACNEMNGRKISWNEALNMTMSVRYARFLGQQILAIIAISAIFIFPFIILAASDQKAFGGLLVFTSFFVIIFLWIKWAFAIAAIAFEDAGVYQAFQRSWYLVAENWWRTFGILLLLNIVIQFALSIITTPISMFALWDFYAEYFKMLGAMGGQQVSPEKILAMLDSMGVGIGLASGVSTILSLLIVPLITVVMYFDLRARKGEFVEQTPPEGMGSI